MERLQWAAAVLEGARYHPRHRRIARNLRNILARGPEELRHLNLRNAANQVNRRISVRRIETPYLTSVLPRLDVFPAGTRQALLSIEAQFRLHNEVVDECREYGRMTFDPSIVGENRESVLGNLRNAEAALAQRAQYIVTLIGNLDLDAEVPRPGEFLEDEPPLPEVQGVRDEVWE